MLSGNIYLEAGIGGPEKLLNTILPFISGFTSYQFLLLGLKIIYISNQESIKKAPGFRRKLLCKEGFQNYFTNNNSLYFGSGHNSLSTINSSLSMW